MWIPHQNSIKYKWNHMYLPRICFVLPKLCSMMMYLAVTHFHYAVVPCHRTMPLICNAEFPYLPVHTHTQTLGSSQVVILNVAIVILKAII